MSLQDDVAEAFKRCNAQEKQIESQQKRIAELKKQSILDMKEATELSGRIRELEGKILLHEASEKCLQLHVKENQQRKESLTAYRELVKDLDVNSNVTSLGRIKLIFDIFKNPDNWLNGNWNGKVNFQSWIDQGLSCIESLQAIEDFEKGSKKK